MFKLTLYDYLSHITLQPSHQHLAKFSFAILTCLLTQNLYNVDSYRLLNIDFLLPTRTPIQDLSFLLARIVFHLHDDTSIHVTT